MDCPTEWWAWGPVAVTPEEFSSRLQVAPFELDWIQLIPGVATEAGLLNALPAAQALAELRNQAIQEHAANRAQRQNRER